MQKVMSSLCPNEVVKAVSRAKIRPLPGFVLPNAGREIGGNAGVHRTTVSIGHDVDPAAL
jgi:hypothetical protein